MIRVFDGKQRGPTKEINPFWLQLAFEFREVIHYFKGSKLHIFLAIALHTDKSGMSFPSYDLLARETGYNRSTIGKTLKELEELEINGQPVLARWRLRDTKGQFFGSNRYLIFPTQIELDSIPKINQDPANPPLETTNSGEPTLEEEPLNKEITKIKEDPLKTDFIYDHTYRNKFTFNTETIWLENIPQPERKLLMVFVGVFGFNPTQDEETFWYKEANKWVGFGYSEDLVHLACEYHIINDLEVKSPKSITHAFRTIRSKIEKKGYPRDVWDLS